MIQDKLSETVIGCAMEVHRRLGPGFLESVYRNALLLELNRAGIPAAAEVRIPVAYRDVVVGEFVADIVVEGSLILELKAVQDLHATHEAQLVNYLQATGRDVGLLLNFGANRLGVKRKHRVFKQKTNPVTPASPVSCFARSRSSHPSGCFPKQAASRVPMRRCSVKNASAFTMIELLVSMAVLSLIVVLLLSMVDNATKMWRQSENRVDAYREARAALNLIASDLASIYSSTNTNFFYFDREPKPLPNVSSALDGKVFFVTALPPTAQGTGQKSDLCTVGYFAGFDKTSITGRGGESMNLYRYFRPSNETFDALKTGDIADGMTISSTPTSDDAEVLAKNITGFKVAAYSKATGTPGELTPFTQSATTPTPDVLEITLSAISNDAAKRFTTQADWQDTNSPNYIQNVRTFTKRVVLNRDASPTP